MAATTTSMPRLRRCVVKIQRIKLHENAILTGQEPISSQNAIPSPTNPPEARAGACDTSVFQPDRNSTMCVSRTQMNVTGANLPNATISPFRIRIKKLPVPKPVETATPVQPTTVSPVQVRLKRIPLAKPAETVASAPPTTTTPVRVRIKRFPLAKPAETATSAQSTTTQAERGHRFFHRDQPPTRSRSSVTRNVYEFLSQSQIEDDKNREDPAADIIKKMVSAGKACVMIRSKKDGRQRAKPVKKVRPVGKRRQCSLKNLETSKSKEGTPEKRIPLAPAAAALSPILEPDNDVIGSSDSEAPNAGPFQVSVSVHSPPQARFSVQRNASTHHPNTPPLHDGAYSHLARSVLLNETKTHYPTNSIERRRQLVNMARKFVSTPLRRKSPSSNVTASAISPIPRQTVVASPSGGASPWRVSDESAMPNTFVFGFNTSQLPSYSSDHIQRRQHVYVPDEAAAAAGPVEDPPNEESICPALNEHSLGSNANDSNEENLPPTVAHKTPTTANDQEDAENVENVVHLPNPRRTLQERAPLKDINILDVVVLPSWKKNIQVTPITPTKATTPAMTSSPANQFFGFDEFLEEENSPKRRRTERNTTVQTPSKSGHLFGFEEFLEGDEAAESRGSTSAPQNVTLHEKLQRLKQLRPTEKELPQVSTAPLRRAGDCFGELQPQQRDIRDVLCSTMLSETTKRQPALAADESAGLFKDSEPDLETTFDAKAHRRTYVKEKPKRKRKQRVQVLYIDSGSSEDEDGENEPDSRDNSVESPKKRGPGPRQKRPRKDVEHEAKLQEFITSFNKECEEVQNYSLVIE
ncbi:protein dalmatian [Drosophila pseudoobscura]|uniref:Protein dalmatian n=1 Tax=Drosophila pseudoobscura pseudoobscura TaxID=46245 RepID=A0A6I8UMT3_DROPS|nr:protein dalmatian [Drosophila pseudoobscura]